MGLLETVSSWTGWTSEPGILPAAPLCLTSPPWVSAPSQAVFPEGGSLEPSALQMPLR